MQHLHIPQTSSTLGVDFNPDSGVLRIDGESYPENAFNFFAPIIDWLQDYLRESEPEVEITMDLDIIYFNSSSSKVLMNIFDMLDEAAANGAGVTIVWRHHEENDISEQCGQEFAEEVCSAKFELQAYGD